MTIQKIDEHDVLVPTVSQRPSAVLRMIGRGLVEGAGWSLTVGAGAGAGWWAVRHVPAWCGDFSRTTAGLAAGLGFATMTFAGIEAVHDARRRATRARATALTSAAAAAAASLAEARPCIIEAACASAAADASFAWAMGAKGVVMKRPELWLGREDGTATWVLAPGYQLRYRPADREPGAHVYGRFGLFTLETAQQSTVVTGPVHLLELLDASSAGPAGPDLTSAE
ncbi:hypothetical protein P8605_14230 [Streptomyces sp. T-3]|nr:hypothetical protein [Streptomyces sp. T-3]